MISQQVNLFYQEFSPKQKRFGAAAMAQVGAACIALGAWGCYAYVDSVNKLIEIDVKTLAVQAEEIDLLNAKLEKTKGADQPSETVLFEKLKNRKADLAKKEALLESVQKGMIAQGNAHSDRLNLIAKSIPSQVWATKIKFDSSLFEVSGVTLDLPALNDWVVRLSADPSGNQFKLTSVTVDYVDATRAQSTGRRPSWSFTLSSAASQAAPSAAVSP